MNAKDLPNPVSALGPKDGFISVKRYYSWQPSISQDTVLFGMCGGLMSVWWFTCVIDGALSFMVILTQVLGRNGLKFIQLTLVIRVFQTAGKSCFGKDYLESLGLTVLFAWPNISIILSAVFCRPWRSTFFAFYYLRGTHRKTWVRQNAHPLVHFPNAHDKQIWAW